VSLSGAGDHSSDYVYNFLARSESRSHFKHLFVDFFRCAVGLRFGVFFHRFAAADDVGFVSCFSLFLGDESFHEQNRYPRIHQWAVSAFQLPPADISFKYNFAFVPFPYVGFNILCAHASRKFCSSEWVNFEMCDCGIGFCV